MKRCDLCHDDFFPEKRHERFCPSCQLLNHDTHVYGLANAKTGEIRYIGSTNRATVRFAVHKKAEASYLSRNPKFKQWLIDTGDDMTMVSLHSVFGTSANAREEARRIEEKEIRKRVRNGERLFNKRHAQRKIYTSDAAHAYLSERLSDII